MKCVSFPEANGKTATGHDILRRETHNLSCIQMSPEEIERLKANGGKLWAVTFHGGDPVVLDALTRAQVGLHISKDCPTGEPQALKIPGHENPKA